MILIRGLYNLKEQHRNTVLTIGNFDGVHRGHQAVLNAVTKKAQELGLKSTVMIFEPQPLEFFSSQHAPSRLTRMSEKLQALSDYGIDQVLLIRFNPDFSSQTADEFIQNILIKGLSVKHLFVGDDFCFGKNRQGNFDTLKQAGLNNNFSVESLHTIADQSGRYSSTRIREHLAEGDFEKAEVCLGRSYKMCGRVVHGHAKGREIGYPTINIELHRNKSPLLGVYAVRVAGLDDDWIDGVASIGNRPVIPGDEHFLLEVFLFDFDRQVYGEHVQVEFIKYIRPELNFDSFDEMRKRIDKDALEARAILGH